MLSIAAEPTEPCKDGEFQCGDSDQCIPYSKVCDTNYDCSNKKDEPLTCGELFFSYCIYLFIFYMLKE